jgi:hypothetical protein
MGNTACNGEENSTLAEPVGTPELGLDAGNRPPEYSGNVRKEEDRRKPSRRFYLWKAIE